MNDAAGITLQVTVHDNEEVVVESDEQHSNEPVEEESVYMEEGFDEIESIIFRYGCLRDDFLAVSKWFKDTRRNGAMCVRNRISVKINSTKFANLDELNKTIKATFYPKRSSMKHLLFLSFSALLSSVSSLLISTLSLISKLFFSSVSLICVFFFIYDFF